MKLFLDNDIILKLGSLDLLDELERIFHISSSNIYILSTAIPYIKYKNKLRTKYTDESLLNILEKIKDYQLIPDNYVDDTKYLYLANIENIDSGERILFALSPPDKDFLILTGDKRSLQELSVHLCDSKIIADLEKRVVCLEHLILKILELRGLDLLEQKMKENNYGGDTGLKFIFNQRALDLEKVNEGLISFYNDLKKHTKDLLL